VLVIPVAIGLGLSPIPVTVISFVGNALPVFGIVALFREWERRRGPVRRRWSPRARRVWDRYGLPGLALAGPAVTGIHLAAVMALALQADRRRTALWMALSLGIWSVATLLVTLAGFEGFRWLFGVTELPCRCSLENPGPQVPLGIAAGGRPCRALS
jgi:Ca2+/H+ antiporter, TMEM165/GDT1 family